MCWPSHVRCPCASIRILSDLLPNFPRSLAAQLPNIIRLPRFDAEDFQSTSFWLHVVDPSKLQKQLSEPLRYLDPASSPSSGTQIRRVPSNNLPQSNMYRSLCWCDLLATTFSCLVSSQMCWAMEPSPFVPSRSQFAFATTCFASSDPESGYPGRRCAAGKRRTACYQRNLTVVHHCSDDIFFTTCTNKSKSKMKKRSQSRLHCQNTVGATQSYGSIPLTWYSRMHKL